MEEPQLTLVDSNDPLLECLVALTHHYKRPYSRHALKAGLPLSNTQLTPTLFVRAAERAGLIAKIIKRPLTYFSNLILPVVLILHNNQACILHKINPNQTAVVSFPEIKQGVIRKSFAEIKETYTGFAILVQPLQHFQSTNEPLAQPDKGSWFWGTLWRYRAAYLEVIIAAFLINILAIVSPLYVMNVYDRVVSNNAFTTLWVLSTGVIIIYSFDMLLRFLRGYVIDVCGKKADTLIASHLFQNVIGMQLVNKPASVGSFVNNLREFEVVRDFFTSATLTTLVDLPFIFLFLTFIWYLGSDLILVPLAIIPIILLSAWLIEIPLRKVVKQALQGANQKHALLVETISGLDTVKSLCAENMMLEKWEHYTSQTAKLSLKSRFLSSAVVNITYYSQQLLTVGIIIVGVYQISEQTLSLGGLIACNILAGRAIAPLGQLANLLTRYQQAKVALQNLDKMMQMPVERPIDKRFLQLAHIRGDIEFANVIFQYPEQQNKAVDGLSLKIQAGERVAIIGRIGSGKTTLHKLLLNLYRPQAGAIYLDGIDILQLDPTDLRRKIGYVGQDNLLFSGNVRDNIAMGYPGAIDEAIIQAAHFAGVDQFVKRHPMGYDMPVGERGSSLSGGQRQAIAIARALLPNPPIILLDEPTSSMDDHSEQELITRLASYLPNKTLLLITHKMSLLGLVNRVIVMDNGKVLLDGPRDQILKQITQPTSAKSR